MRNDRFHKGVFPCELCGRQTRGQTDAIMDIDMCQQCYDLAGDDNMHNDDGTTPDAEQMAHYNKLLAEIVEKGGDGEKVKALNDYLWTSPQIDIDTVLMAYITCALWSSTDDDGEPLDDYDLREDAHETMRADVANFVTSCSDLDLSEMDAEQFGHDFWLTRNGHGAGFWDRGLGELGDILTERCKPYGECNLYVDDGGEVGVL